MQHSIFYHTTKTYQTTNIFSSSIIIIIKKGKAAKILVKSYPIASYIDYFAAAHGALADGALAVAALAHGIVDLGCQLAAIKRP